MTTGVYFFNHDLRTTDNALLAKAADEVDQLICIYCFEPWQLALNQQNLRSLGKKRKRFLTQTLWDLDRSLRKFGQHLIVSHDSAEHYLQSVLNSHEVHKVYFSHHVGTYERKLWTRLQAQHPQIKFESMVTHTLFDIDKLAFDLNDFPHSFTQFRKLVEANPVLIEPTLGPYILPPSPMKAGKPVLAKFDQYQAVVGGESAAQEHLRSYFSGELPANYKEVRNSLDGWQNSTKFSLWLANGSLSPKSVCAALKTYESNVVANNSTYWIYFELLWREFFHWYAFRYNNLLYRIDGINHRKPLTSYYPERFTRWCNGNTPYPLVNACMRELNETGYLSNRGRQIAASCLINELSVDWRFGAAYFEQQLIDYDVASNWGNWQYIAGVGAGSNQRRHFNIEKQTDMFDPDGDYRDKWGAFDVDTQLDSVDAADWPIG